MSIGEYIKQLREHHGLSQRQLAQYANISNTEIWRIEVGERQEPSPNILKIIAPYLGVSYLDLYLRAGYIDEELIQTLKKSKELLLAVKSIAKDEDNLCGQIEILMQGIE